MVVIVDENSGESATAILEDQLQVRTYKVDEARHLGSEPQSHTVPILHVQSVYLG